MKQNFRSFPDFIKEIENMTLLDILIKCEETGKMSEKEYNQWVSFLPAKERKFVSSDSFTIEIKKLIFWLKNGMIITPNPEYVYLYQKIANNLIAKGNIKKEVLSLLK